MKSAPRPSFQELPSVRLSTPWVNRWRARKMYGVWWLRTHVLRYSKRSLDIAVALIALMLLSPLFLLIACAIKLTDRGPVLFWQQRVGRYGSIFSFPKFRSMHVNASVMQQALKEHNAHGKEGVTFKMKNDPRVTRVGKFLRRSSLDELPQLWCVLTGSMSLVGPRPPLVSEVARYTLEHRARLSVVPGLTCIWQVNGRSEVPFQEQLQMDLNYIHHPSLWADIKLLLKTIPAVLKGRGAY